MATLSDKQRRFADEYLVDMNITQAAIRAGYKKIYADKHGYMLLRNKEVAAYIEEGQRRMQKATGMTRERVLKELSAIAFADIADYIRVWESETGMRAELTPTEEIPAEKRAAIAGIKEGTKGIEIKLYDKLSALEKLGKHLGLFSEDGDGVVNIIHQIPEPEGEATANAQ